MFYFIQKHLMGRFGPYVVLSPLWAARFWIDYNLQGKCHQRGGLNSPITLVYNQLTNEICLFLISSVLMSSLNKRILTAWF